MAPWLLRKWIQWKFNRTSRAKGIAQIRKHLQSYLELLAELTDEQACQGARVGKMIGVDEDMRGWSLCELIEHNTIVNRALEARVIALVTGVESEEYEDFDVKKDVMPGLTAEPFLKSDVGRFVASVESYLSVISEFEELKTGAKAKHPIFGMFSAHQFHIMYGFHLGLHMKQARSIVNSVKSGSLS